MKENQSAFAARATVTARSLGLLARRPVTFADDLRFDRYGIRGFLLVLDRRLTKTYARDATRLY